MAETVFNLTVNNETAITRNWQGRTLRQLFENAMSRGLIGENQLTGVTVNVNNQNLGGLDTSADSIVAQLPAGTTEVYVTLVATTGTKQSFDTSSARRLLGELADAGWSVDADADEPGIFHFSNDETHAEHSVVVSATERLEYADVGSPKLIAAVLLKQTLDAKAAQRAAVVVPVATATAPATPRQATDAARDSIIATLANALGVERDAIRVTISVRDR